MKYFILSLFALSPILLLAQTLEDAVRYSQLEVGGTARSMGIGGGIGALGADFSVLSTNPAGLAAFRRSEFSFTPVFTMNNNESQLGGTDFSNSSNKANFGFSQVGLVFASKPLSLNWTNIAFAFGLNRLASFHQKAYFEGTSPGSITDRWANLAQGYAPDNLGFEEGLAFDAAAIYNPIGGNDNTVYYSDFDPNEEVWRSQNIKRKGGYNEMVISYAGNFKDRLMIGATLGIPFVNYEENKTYIESDVAGTNDVFTELTYGETLKTSGVGINLKVGAVLRVNQMVRLGAAIHTPTGIGLKDDFSSDLSYSYEFNGPKTGQAESPEGSFEYRMRTPWRLIGSAGLIFGKSGFLVAEVEYLDYTNAQFKFNEDAEVGDLEYEFELNEQIGGQLNSALNIRLGGEYALDKFRFRGGYTIMQSPYAEGFEATGVLSLGAGAWLSEGIFMDAAYRRRTSGEQQYSPYILNSEPAQPVTQTDTRSQFLVTLGFKF